MRSNAVPVNTLAWFEEKHPILLTHHFLTMWKHAPVICILKPRKEPALPSSSRPISLLDTIGKIFEKNLPAGTLHEVSERGLSRDEQFGFRPRQSTSLQLACLVERITRNFGEKRLTGAVLLDVVRGRGHVVDIQTEENRGDQSTLSQSSPHDSTG
jgi:hypothetical protein